MSKNYGKLSHDKHSAACQAYKYVCVSQGTLTSTVRSPVDNKTKLKDYFAVGMLFGSGLDFFPIEQWIEHDATSVELKVVECEEMNT